MSPTVARGQSSPASTTDVATAGEPGWQGLSILRGGKAYADTPMGQVHYRDVGPRNGRWTMLLLHQTPLSMIEYGGIQSALAARGIRSIAVDTPGYGLSDAPPGYPTIEALADNLLPVLDRIGVRRVVIGGHHTGASIATAFAARHPDRTAALFLHGTPLLDAQERAGFQNRKEWDRTPRADGSHLSFLFAASDGKPASADVLRARTWMAVMMYLQGTDIGHHAAFRYDMAPDLARIHVPGLIITDANDPIHAIDEKVAAMRPDFRLRQLSAESTGAIIYMPDKWADIVAAFLADLPQGKTR